MHLCVGQPESSEDGRRPAVLRQLFARIRALRLRDEYDKRIGFLTPPVYVLLVCVFIPIFIWFPIHTYNILKGPFHMDLNQFTNHLISFNQRGDDGSYLQIRSWPFRQEYFQIELGEDQIEQESAHILRESDSYYSYFRPSYTMKAVQNDEIYQALYPNRLFIKLAARGQNHFHSRLPYRFHLFTIKTLRCIVRQLDVKPTSYMKWHDKATFVERIEEIYGRNSTAFNMKVLTKCGILIGYLYRPQDSTVYMPGWKVPHLFHNHDIALDTSSSYFPYKIYLCYSIVFTCILVYVLSNLIIYHYQMHWARALSIPYQVEDQLRQLELGTLQELDEAILHTPTERRYMDRMFLIRNQYLIIFTIDLNECNPNTLYEFYDKSPFIVIPVGDIELVSSLGVTVSHESGQNFVRFPYLYPSDADSVSHWLHSILMDISERYQRCYHEEELRREEEARQRRLTELINEERQRQLENYFNSIVQREIITTPASPRFIGEFRMTPPRTVENDDKDLLKRNCTVCQNNFESGQDYANWPCDPRHTCHYTCMLDLLRISHTCPECRGAVESAEVFDTETAARYLTPRPVYSMEF